MPDAPARLSPATTARASDHTPIRHIAVREVHGSSDIDHATARRRSSLCDASQELPVDSAQSSDAKAQATKPAKSRSATRAGRA